MTDGRMWWLEQLGLVGTRWCSHILTVCWTCTETEEEKQQQEKLVFAEQHPDFVTPVWIKFSVELSQHLVEVWERFLNHTQESNAVCNRHTHCTPSIHHSHSYCTFIWLHHLGPSVEHSTRWKRDARSVLLDWNEQTSMILHTHRFVLHINKIYSDTGNVILKRLRTHTHTPHRTVMYWRCEDISIYTPADLLMPLVKYKCVVVIQRDTDTEKKKYI